MVTGGSRGIGLGLASALGEAGAAVAVVARSADSLAAAVDTLRGRGVEAISYQYDLTDLDGIDGIYRRVVADGAVDILVNCAGVTRRGLADQIEDADWDLVHRVNVTAVFRMCRAFGRVHDFIAAAVVKSDVESYPRIIPGFLDVLVELIHELFGQFLGPPAHDYPHALPLHRFQFLTQSEPDQFHDAVDLELRPAPVLRRESIHRHHLNAQI